MAQQLSGNEPSGNVGSGSTTQAVPGEMAARIDRLPLSFMHWELAAVVMTAFCAVAASDNFIPSVYPFLWEPRHIITPFEYSTVYAFSAGLGILFGAYLIGWLSDHIGRRKAWFLCLLISGGLIIPFAYVTNPVVLVGLAFPLTWGFGGALVLWIAYMTEMVGPGSRSRLIMLGQVWVIILLNVGIDGWIPHYWIPSQYLAFMWLLSGMNFFMLVVMFFRLPESPRWLEVRGRVDEARKIVERMEARVMKRHPVLPEPDLKPYQGVVKEHTNIFSVFEPSYRARTILLMVVFALLYGGMIYGAGAEGFVFLAITRGYSASFVFAIRAWAGLIAGGFYAINALLGDRVERKTMILVGAVLACAPWYGIYFTHNTSVISVLYVVYTVGLTIFLYNLYAYAPLNFPTRMRSVGVSWSDGFGHLGAWGGILLVGVIFTQLGPLPWILVVTTIGGIIPAGLAAIFGIRTRGQTLETISR